VDKEPIKARVRAAFANGKYPGDDRLRGSDEGDEPFLLEQEFRGKTDWQSLDPVFLDHAPDGFSSALSFFSDEAFCFYLPAYLLADLDGQLESSQPVFHLTHGLTSQSRDKKVNPRRYGDLTWREVAEQKFDGFSESQAAAIVAYLEFKRATDEMARESIDEALAHFWRQRAGHAEQSLAAESR
jgi:hypothetical protein